MLQVILTPKLHLWSARGVDLMYLSATTISADQVIQLKGREPIFGCSGARTREKSKGYFADNWPILGVIMLVLKAWMLHRSSQNSFLAKKSCRQAWWDGELAVLRLSAQDRNAGRGTGCQEADALIEKRAPAARQA